MRKLSIALSIVFFCFANLASAQPSASMAMPDILVYKTKGDYRKLVPVLLSPDKKRVVSYPDPTDVVGGSGPEPVSLHKGYLLDKRGVGWNTAFIKLTYEEYGKLPAVPSPEELYNMIVDKNPLTELYDCGRREPMKNQVHRMNDMIDEGKIKKKCTNMNNPKYKL